MSKEPETDKSPSSRFGHLWQPGAAVLAAVITAIAVLASNGRMPFVRGIFTQEPRGSDGALVQNTGHTSPSNGGDQPRVDQKFTVKESAWVQEPLEFILQNFVVTEQSVIATIKVSNKSQRKLKVAFDCNSLYLPKSPVYRIGNGMTRTMNAKLTDSSGTSIQLMQGEGVTFCEYDILMQKFRFSPVSDIINLMSGLGPGGDLTVTLRFSPLTRNGPADIRSLPELEMNFGLQASFWYSEDKPSGFTAPVRLTASFEQIRPKM